MARKFNINSRTVTAPLAAFVMASILFVYARTSIQAAKRNAQKHREADGGQISWRNESLRRHGALEPPEEQGVVRQLLMGGGVDGKDRGKGKGTGKGKGKEKGKNGEEGVGVVQGLGGGGRTEEEERVRAVAAASMSGEGLGVGRGRGKGKGMDGG